MGKPRGNFSEKNKQNVSSNHSGRRGIKKRSGTRKKINYENVKQAFNENLIPNLNKQTLFKNKDGTCPSLLGTALYNKDYKLVNFLLEQGADPNLVNQDGQTFILQVLSMREPEKDIIDMIRSLINAGANIEISGVGRYRNHFPSIIAMSQYPEVFKLLINNGANMYAPCIAKNHLGCSLLSRAIMLGHHDTVDFLLKKGMDVNKHHCKEHIPPLFHAVKNDDVELIKRLIDYGADINIINQSHGTPLLYALKNWSFKAMSFLLSHVLIDVNIINFVYNNESIVHCAVRYCEKNYLDYLLNANPDINIVNMKNQNAVEFIEWPPSLENIEKVKEHIVKLRAAGFFLIEQNLSAVSGEEYDDFYGQCCQQVDLMKKIKITTTSHANFYDLLFMSVKKLALCLESLENQKILPSGFHGKFPLYAGMIEDKLKKAIQWNELRDGLNDAVYCLFNNHLPYHIMEKIFSYFSGPELMKLRKRYRKKITQENHQVSDLVRMDDINR